MSASVICRSAITFSCAIAACGDQSNSALPVTTIDSAGFVIYTAHAPRDTIQDISVGRRVIATIGVRNDGVELENVREAARLSDGTLVFIESRARELKTFHGRTGVRTIGRQGDGPGEMRFPVNLARLRGDSIQVYDRRHAKVSVFDASGMLAYEVQLANAPQQRLPNAVWRFQDTLLLGLVPRTESRRELARVEGVGDMGLTSVAAVLINMRGAVVDTVAMHPGYADIRTPGSSLAPAYGVDVPIALTERGEIVYGSGESPSFFRLSPDRDQRQIFRLHLSRRPVDRDSLHALLAGDRALMTRIPIDDNPVLIHDFLPDSQPAYKELRVFDNDNVWLGSANPFQTPSSVWHIVSPAGVWLAAIGLPPDSRLLDVGSDYIVLRRTGSLDTQYIEVYEWDLAQR